MTPRFVLPAPALPIDPQTVKGFLDAEEGAALHAAAHAFAPLGPALEIGSYCGKSALYLGTGARAAGGMLFTLDHHRGSEEMQPGWEHHDPETWDEAAGRMDTLPFLRDTLARAGLEDAVVVIVGRSDEVARRWRTPLGLVFIDGGHSLANARADYEGWSPHLVAGGVLAIHDVFPDPADGGRAPYEIWKMALASGRFAELAAVKSLRFLRRV